jgi:beta-galactosidase GanA
MRQLLSDLLAVITVHNNNAFTRNQLFDSSEGVLKHRAAVNHSAKLLNAATTTEFGKEIMHSDAIASR